MNQILMVLLSFIWAFGGFILEEKYTKSPHFFVIYGMIYGFAMGILGVLR